MADTAQAVADLESNVWSMYAILGSGPGGSVLDTPTRLVVESPVPKPPYNGVWRFYDEGDRAIGEQIDDLLVRFEQRAVEPIWLIHPTTPETVPEELTSRGWERVDLIHGMAAPLESLPPAPDPPDMVEVVECDAGRGGDAWLHLVSWRYGLDTTSSSYLSEVYGNAIGGHTRLWLAYREGTAISKAGLHVSDGVAGIYGVATTEAGRGLGLASLLTLHALHAAAAEGVTRSVLHSTPMAHSLYQRLGFDDVAMFEVWAKPGTLHL